MGKGHNSLNRILFSSFLSPCPLLLSFPIASDNMFFIVEWFILCLYLIFSTRLHIAKKGTTFFGILTVWERRTNSIWMLLDWLIKKYLEFSETIYGSIQKKVRIITANRWRFIMSQALFQSALKILIWLNGWLIFFKCELSASLKPGALYMCFISHLIFITTLWKAITVTI